MLECEEQIRQALDEGGRLATQECLQNFDTDGSPIQLGGIKGSLKNKFRLSRRSSILYSVRSNAGS